MAVDKQLTELPVLTTLDSTFSSYWRNSSVINPDYQVTASVVRGFMVAHAIVEDYGAAGDGVTDDTIAIRLAIATGRHVDLKKGSIYLISGELPLSAGQHLYGNGATLKRRAQVVTTTTTTITADVTTDITLASVTGLSVGMDLAFSQGAQSGLIAGSTLATNNPRITAINGSVITVFPAPNCSFTGTVNVWSAYYAVVLDDNCRVYDLIIDGNKSNYTKSRWETTEEIRIEGDYAVAENCKIINTPGEAFILSGLYNTISGGWVLDAAGNGVHLSGATNPKIDGLHVINANLDTTIGHQGGCITSSADFTDTIITNCYLSGSAVGGIGFSLTSASHNTFTNNLIRDCGYGIFFSGTCSNTIIANNRIYDCDTRGLELISLSVGYLDVVSNQITNCDVKISGSGTEKSISFSHNQIIGGDLLLIGVTGVKADDNFINGGQVSVQANVTYLDLTGNTINNTGDTTTVGIALLNSGNIGINIGRNTFLTARGFATIPAGRTYRQVVNAVWNRFFDGFDINQNDVAE